MTDWPMLHTKALHWEVLRVASRQHRGRRDSRGGNQAIGLSESDSSGRVLPAPFTGAPALGQAEVFSHAAVRTSLKGTVAALLTAARSARTGEWA
jgi:hypothetical protein